MPEWLTLSNVADVIGVAGGFFALMAWMQTHRLRRELEKERQRQSRKIRVELTNGARSISVPVEFRRSEFTRSEIQGRLGVIPMKKKGTRYSLDFLNTPEFLRRIEEIGNDQGDSVLIIPVTNEELTQFDI